MPPISPRDFQIADFGAFTDALSSGIDSAQNAKLLELKKAAAEQKAAQAQQQSVEDKLKQKKLEAEVKLKEADVQNIGINRQQQSAKTGLDQTKLLKEALVVASMGDIQGANELNRMAGFNDLLVKHPDPQKAAKGIFGVVDPQTNELIGERDPFAVGKIEGVIDAQIGAFKKAQEIKATQGKDKRQFLTQFVSSESLSRFGEAGISPKQALQIGESVWQQANRSGGGKSLPIPGVDDSEGKDTKTPPIADVPPEFQNSRLRASAQINAAMSLDDVDPLGKPILKKKSMSNKDSDQLNGILATNDTLNSIAARFLDLEQSLVSQPGILNTPLQDLANKFGQDDPRFRALMSEVGLNRFKQIYLLSGAQYSDEQLDRLAPLFPQENDTISQVIGKISGLTGLNNMSAASRLQVLESRGDVRLGKLPQLFFGKDIGDLSRPEIAASAIINSMPERLMQGGKGEGTEADKKAYNTFVRSLTPQIRKAFDAQMSEQGVTRPDAAYDNFKDALGLGQ